MKKGLLFQFFYIFYSKSSLPIKKLTKNLKNSQYFRNLIWLPVHQVDTSIVNHIVKKEKVTETILPDTALNLKENPEIYIIHEEISNHEQYDNKNEENLKKDNSSNGSKSNGHVSKNSSNNELLDWNMMDLKLTENLKKDR